MSSDQPTLHDYTHPTTSTHPVRTRTPQDWTPGGTDQPDRPRNQCKCGNHVTRSYRVQYADAQGYVHACPDCQRLRDLVRHANGIATTEEDNSG